MALAVFQQIIIMLLLMLAGAFLTRRGYLPDAVTKKLGSLLLAVVIPDVIVRSLAEPGIAGDYAGLAASFGLAALGLGLSCALSYLVYGRRHPIEDFSSSYSNPSFFAIPLVTAVYGDGAVFYMVGYIALLNILQWTYGSWVLTGDKGKVSPRAILTSPVLIATEIGVALYLLDPPLPYVVTGVLDMVAQLNTPLAMLVLGSYLATLSPRRLFCDARAYLVCLFRLVVCPLLLLAGLWLLGLPEGPLSCAVMLAACAPVGAGVAIYAQQYDLDSGLAVKHVCLSTILSAVTIPCIYQLTTMVL